MEHDDHSFRKLLPGFVISAGTQVVLKVVKVLADGQRFKPPGSVGVVLESPPHNRQPYLAISLPRLFDLGLTDDGGAAVSAADEFAAIG